MASSIYSTGSSTSTAQLDSYFETLVQNIMTVESQSLTRLTTQKDTITLQKSAYTDLSSKLSALNSATKAMLKSDPFYSMTQGRKVSISADTGTVVTANAGSAALEGDYSISVTQLARGQKVRSAQQAYADQALGLSGTFALGGAAARSISDVVTNETVTGFSMAASDSELVDQELGSGDYYIETRENEGVWQFRVVDSNGKAIEILKNGSASDLTATWQNIPTGGGEVNTGRGLKFTLAASGYDDYYRTTANAAKVTYTAKGASIAVEATDSLNDIAEKINAADYGEGNEVVASVVDRQLILKTKNTGANQSIGAVDVGTDTVLQQLGVLDAGGAYLNYNVETDSARNAIFTVDNMTIERSTNSNLTDVISGVSLNLAADAEGKTATLTISEDNTSPKTYINSFITSFNSLQTYLKGKLATTKNDDGTYTRGTFAGETNFRSLNLELYTAVSSDAANDSEYLNLMDIGIELNDDMSLSIADSSKLEEALSSNYEGVESLINAVMTKVDAKLSYNAGDNGYVERAIDDADNRLEALNTQITSQKSRLSIRENSLREQYLAMQIQIESMKNDYSLMSSLLSYNA
jgi:flagellar hook-associated protein 2